MRSSSEPKRLLTYFSCSVSVPPPLKTFGAGGTLFSDVSVHDWVCASWKLCEYYISKTNEGNFTQFWSQMHLGL